MTVTGAKEMQDPPEGESPREARVACDAYEMEDGRLVLYDDRNPDAYLRSDLHVAVEP